jgi:vitamin K-dependent gamma-carboxylase
MHPWWARRLEPTDNAGLVLFRALFGGLMVCECAGALATGWVTRAFVEPTIRFPIIGFGWLPAPAGPSAYAYYALMAVLAAMVAAGIFYRGAIVAFGLLWTASYLMQTVYYNNHYYLIALLSFLLALTPATADFSCDARFHPTRRSRASPRWCQEILMLQVAIVFAFAAYAKWQPDWLAAKPFDVWLSGLARTRSPAWLFEQPWLKWVLVWGGITFDALVIPALLWRRTRIIAAIAAIGFHLFNSFAFRVGVFPYLGISFLVLFFPPESIRANIFREPPANPAATATAWTPLRRAFAMMLVCYFALQVGLPLRHHIYPGNVDWHEEGHRMSWRMMLRAKRGTVRFTVVDKASGHTWEVDPRPRLTQHQREKIAIHPDLIWLFACELKDEFAARGFPDVTVHADSRVSLNGRPRAPLVDSTVDLASTPWRYFRYNTWITQDSLPPSS